MGEGLVLVIAGLLLILPGFATDAIGLACLFPPVHRRLLTPWMRSQRRRNMGRPGPGASRTGTTLERSEERRVGKEGRYGRARYHCKKEKARERSTSRMRRGSVK